MADCPNKDKNKNNCKCSYTPCSRKGMCCECLRYHLSHGELPGCCFPAAAEKTYDRSFANFVKTYKGK